MISVICSHFYIVNIYANHRIMNEIRELTRRQLAKVASLNISGKQLLRASHALQDKQGTMPKMKHNQEAHNYKGKSYKSNDLTNLGLSESRR